MRAVLQFLVPTKPSVKYFQKTELLKIVREKNIMICSAALVLWDNIKFIVHSFQSHWPELPTYLHVYYAAIKCQ